jgi:hypothetical protein
MRKKLADTTATTVTADTPFGAITITLPPNADEMRAQLAKAVEAFTEIIERIDARRAVGRASFTLPEFAQRHGMSQSHLYVLIAEGRGPDLMLTGKAGKRVSLPAESRWIEAREREAEAAEAPKRVVGKARSATVNSTA